MSRLQIKPIINKGQPFKTKPMKRRKKVRFNEIKLTDNQLLMIGDALSSKLQEIEDDISWKAATQRDAEICQSAAHRIARFCEEKGIHKKRDKYGNEPRNITK